MRASTRNVLLEGLRGAAEYGTAAALRQGGVSALAKTGTAPMPGGGAMGLVVALSPAAAPTHGTVVVVPGAAGLDAAAVAADLLNGAGQSTGVVAAGAERTRWPGPDRAPAGRRLRGPGGRRRESGRRRRRRAAGARDRGAYLRPRQSRTPPRGRLRSVRHDALPGRAGGDPARTRRRRHHLGTGAARARPSGAGVSLRLVRRPSRAAIGSVARHPGRCRRGGARRRVHRRAGVDQRAARRRPRTRVQGVRAARRQATRAAGGGPQPHRPRHPNRRRGLVAVVAERAGVQDHRRPSARLAARQEHAVRSGAHLHRLPSEGPRFRSRRGTLRPRRQPPGGARRHCRIDPGRLLSRCVDWSDSGCAGS